MGRAPCCDKTKVKRGPWSPEEDTILKNYLEKNGTGGNWIALPHKAGLKRCGKSCRLRWLNYLRPDIKHGGFTEAEDHMILTLYNNIGSRWSVIASHLPGRTDNDVKNYWNTKLKKKILGGRTASLNTTNASATINNNYNISTITSMHFSSTPSSAFVKPVNTLHYGNPASFFSNSSTLPYQTDLNHQQSIFPNLLLSCQVQFPLPGFMEVQENGTSAYGSLSTVSLSQEVSSNSSSFSLEKSTHVSWPINEGREDDGFMMELGSAFPSELLNGFDFQEKITEATPKPASYSSYSNLLASTSDSEPLQEFYRSVSN